MDEQGTRKEAFDVVMLKNGSHSETATVEDFRRVSVTASDPLQAQMSDEVEAARKDGYYVLFAAKPGVLTDPEVHARRRSFEVGTGSTRLPNGDNPFAMTDSRLQAGGTVPKR